MKTDIEDWSNDAENSALLSQKKKMKLENYIFCYYYLTYKLLFFIYT